MSPPSRAHAPRPRAVSTRRVRVWLQRGSATVEGAFALAALVIMLTLLVGAITAGAAQIVADSAAGTAARMAARGDDSASIEAAVSAMWSSAQVSVSSSGGVVTAEVVVPHPLRDGNAQAVAANEESTL